MGMKVCGINKLSQAALRSNVQCPHVMKKQIVLHDQTRVTEYRTAEW
jgi:hypothetical protein